ncbi:hypothetical protein ACVNP1_01235 [Staphylococcus aureus]
MINLKVDVPGLKDLGASGVLEVGNNMQAIFLSKRTKLKMNATDYEWSSSRKPYHELE